MINGAAVGLLGIRYAVISNKYTMLCLLCFFGGMSCYMIATLDYDNYWMITAGVLTCLFFALMYSSSSTWTLPIFFCMSWLWYSYYLEDIICTLATSFIALDICLTRFRVDTPIVYMALLSHLLLSERSNYRKRKMI